MEALIGDADSVSSALPQFNIARSFHESVKIHSLHVVCRAVEILNANLIRLNQF